MFNLVESLDGKGCLIHLFPALLDAMGLPYSGAHTEAIWLTNPQGDGQRAHVASRIADPALDRTLSAGFAVVALFAASMRFKALPGSAGSSNPYGSMPRWDWRPDNVVEDACDQSLEQTMQRRAPSLGGVCFAEVFVEGREFNLSVLAGPKGPQVLPPAEIIFEGFGAGQPRIVGYRAKWDVNSDDYHRTPRRFDFGTEDNPLLDELQALALQAWQLFGLRGYARVDFRVDEQGRPWILEINANPCLSPDAGFAAALARAGIDFTLAVKWIVADGIEQPQYRRIRSADLH